VVSRYSQLHADILTQSDAQEQLLQDWVLWQRGRGMSDKTITDRLTIIRRIPDAAAITPQGVDRFLTSAAWAKATRANYHGAIRAWCKWLIITGRRADDPTTIATTPKVKKGRPRPVADEHLMILLDTRMYKRTRAMILLAAYAGLRVSEIAAIKGDDVNTITVVGKGDKERQVPLHPILKDLAAVMPRRGWWFPTYVGNTKPRRRTHARQLRQLVHLERDGPRRHPRHPPRPAPLVRLRPARSRCRLPGHQRTHGPRILGHHRHLRRRTTEATKRRRGATSPHQLGVGPINFRGRAKSTFVVRLTKGSGGRAKALRCVPVASVIGS